MNVTLPLAARHVRCLAATKIRASGKGETGSPAVFGVRGAMSRLGHPIHIPGRWETFKAVVVVFRRKF
jgi:hypothetical protein